MSFDREAALARWRACCLDMLEWLLERPGREGLLDSKRNPITLADYGPADGLRGPDWTYGWIQGRGLEALASFAAALEGEAPDLAARLDAKARALYRRLDGLRARDGHLYFLYDREMRPVRPEGAGVAAQSLSGEVWTYSDLFAAKGLVAASARLSPEDLPRHLAYLAEALAAIREGRFQMDEKAPLGAEALSRQPEDFGPRMIALGACRLLERLGRPEARALAESFGPEFVAHVLERHVDPKAQVLRNVPGAPEVNAGHGIEMAGFVLSSEVLARPEFIEPLCGILRGSFALAFHPPGIRLSVHAETGEILNPRAPWWALPETIRAASWAWRLSGEAEFARILAAADEAFFTRFWRPEARLAYQTLTEDGPEDYVPATPDLDPSYHTGLSLLAAAEALSHPVPSSAGAAHGSR